MEHKLQLKGKEVKISKHTGSSNTKMRREMNQEHDSKLMNTINYKHHYRKK